MSNFKYINYYTLKNISNSVRYLFNLNNTINITELDNIFYNHMSYEEPYDINTQIYCGIVIGRDIEDYPGITNFAEQIYKKTGKNFASTKIDVPIFMSTKVTSYGASFNNAIDFSPICGTSVVSMANIYNNCQNMTGSPVCGPNVIDMSSTYLNCENLTGSPVCGPNVIDMSNTYSNCYNLTGSPVCGPNVTNMSKTYNYCRNLTGSPVCGPNVTNMTYTYYSCRNLTGSPVCGPNVIDMYGTYLACYNLTGSPVCGPNVTNMTYTYDGCYRLTGSPVCGLNVTNMDGTYINCYNLTGSPVCGPNVIDMNSTYYHCNNLTGSPVCGLNVTNMNGTYINCSNLTGSIVLDGVMGTNKTFNIVNTFKNCINLQGAYLPGTLTQRSLANMTNAFYRPEPKEGETYKRLNIIVTNSNVYGLNWFNILGCTVAGSATDFASVELPFTYGNGTEYYRKNYVCKRGKFNELYNVYVYSTV